MDLVKAFILNPKKSSKPYMITFGESLIYSIIVIIFGILALYIDLYIKDDLHQFKLWSTWRTLFIQFVIIGVVVAFVLEYSGFNRMLSESSMEYYNNSWRKAVVAKRTWKDTKLRYGETSTEAKQSYDNYQKIKSNIVLNADDKK